MPNYDKESETYQDAMSLMYGLSSAKNGLSSAMYGLSSAMYGKMSARYGRQVLGDKNDSS